MVFVRQGTAVALSVLISISCSFAENEEPTRINQIQLIGTHNSYHIALPEKNLKRIGIINRGLKDSLEYTHRPLTEQLQLLGVRHFELDVFADPKGGHYSKRKAPNLLGLNAPVMFSKEMEKPGFKVLHDSAVDYLSTTPTLVSALKEIKAWSTKNPSHVPVFILLEMKDKSPVPLSKKPVPFTRSLLEGVEKEILSVFKKEQIITPDSVRGKFKTLKESILKKGWPSLDSSRGKVMFGLDNGGKIRAMYIEKNPSLQGRLLFASVGENDPGAAFFKLNDPIRSHTRIKRLVKSGFMVRTRADSDTREARRNDTFRRDKALSSGAQFVSTDYPEPNKEFSDYSVSFEGKVKYRANPVNGNN
ncbi:MAG: phosphatidylinositol-specific phospholipase C1-like protein [Verrucomicrobiales bacterium]|nr:phosphatidylinositol-specific phospholipase C1-like protein [Verrucomicrobiales bacterium]